MLHTRSLTISSSSSFVSFLQLFGRGGFHHNRRVDYTAEDWVPIVILSAHDEDDYIQRALDCGADVYLKKPINSVQLLGQINFYPKGPQ